MGLAIFKRSAGPLSRVASIHGLKIAAPWQGRGWGHTVFRLAVDYLKAAWPDVESLKLAVDAENLLAIAVYRAFGVRDGGPVFQGPNGNEHRMVID